MEHNGGKRHDDGESADFVVMAWRTNVPLLYCPKDIGWSLLNEFYNLTEQLRSDITHWMPLPEQPKEDKS